jgi:hypothetical protein
MSDVLEYPDLAGHWPHEVTTEMIAFVKAYGLEAYPANPDAYGAALLAAVWLSFHKAGYHAAAERAYNGALLAMPPGVFIQMCKLRSAFEAWQQKMSRPVDELEVSVRVAHCLARLGVKTLGQLAQMTTAKLLREPNFGKLSLGEVEMALKAYGLRLRPGRYQPQDVDKPKQPAVAFW